MPQFRKKPVVIEARQYVDAASGSDVIEWMDGIAHSHGGVDVIHINTLEGIMNALPGDWIIQGVQGEFYPCKSDIFEATYERVADDSLPTVPGGEAS